MIRIKLFGILGKRRMSQAELARKTNLRPATICEMYNEVCDRVNLKYLNKICNVLKCDLNDIIEFTPDE